MNQEDKVPYVVTSKSYTAVAINAASKAGEWIKSKLGTVKQLGMKSGAQDLVTEVDKGAEQMIRKLILTHFPDHHILGEEGVEPGPQASADALKEALDEDYVWIVDPIDGTTNYVHGFPFYCVSIALAYQGEVIVGVIYDPSRDELFVAEKGKGCYVHGNRMEVSAEGRLSESLIATGFPVGISSTLPMNMAGLQHLVPKVRNIRSGGSAALHMAYVAAGRLSGFWEIGLNAWDLAAGALIVQESGGSVSDTLGRPYDLSVRNVVASNRKIHSEFVEALKEANATGLNG
ncbi:inositol monophosphatase family protein [Paenibacillus pini]|uniref:inositol monophosphatase family protein n=1 Tax=Paenibacillus pini TaxID=669461 RepID=UPI00055CBE62|nr:inositol monophosphatase family protein [Paenibacillus pini]